MESFNCFNDGDADMSMTRIVIRVRVLLMRRHFVTLLHTYYIYTFQHYFVFSIQMSIACWNENMKCVFGTFHTHFGDIRTYFVLNYGELCD